MPGAIADLAERWRRARLAALRAAVSTAGEPPGALEEAAALEGASEEVAEEALRRVFDNSLELGKGFRRSYRVDLPQGDLAALLPRLGAPCLAGEWRRDPEAGVTRLGRPGCEASPRSPRTCDYWREATGGLVLGLTCGVRHARHQSRGRGDPRCMDVLYVHPQSPARYGPIPDQVRAGLDSLRRSTRLFDSTFELEFLGINENVLYYTATRGESAGDLSLAGHVERGVARRFPWLTPREVSPRPVLSDAQPRSCR